MKGIDENMDTKKKMCTLGVVIVLLITVFYISRNVDMKRVIASEAVEQGTDGKQGADSPGTQQIVVQRGNDIYINKVSSETSMDQNEALALHLHTLYAKAYRGFFSSTNTLYGEKWLDNKISFLAESETVDEDYTSLTNNHYVRLIETPYVRKPGENAPSRKDIVFFVNPEYPEDMFIAAQDPVNLKEWTIYQVSEYGKWLQKEIDLYIWGTKGL